MQIFIGLMILVCTATLIWGLLALVTAVRCLKRPRRHSMVRAISMGLPVDPEEAGWDVDSWSVSCPDGIEMPVWSIRTGGAGPVTVLIHDWGDSRIECLPLVSEWKDESAMVVMPDLRGHGDAAGICTFGRLEIADIEILIRSLDAEHVGVVGHGYAANLISELQEQPDITLQRVCDEPWTREGLHERLVSGGFPIQLPGWLLDLAIRRSGVFQLVDRNDPRS